jgi:cyclic-di-AMP phosphodiesterase PgpH
VKTFISSFLKISNLFYRIILFVVSVAIIVYFFPKEGKFKYEYKQGMPWMHETLNSPFDFPIYKTDNEVAQEKDSIANNEKPFFRFDPGILPTQERLFEQKFEVVWKQAFNIEIFDSIQNALKSGIENEIKLIFEEVFQVGILPDLIRNQELSTNISLVVIHDNVAEQMSPDELFSRSFAIASLEKEISRILYDNGVVHDQSVQFVSALDIGELVVANLNYDLEISDLKKQQELDNISLTYGLIRGGDKIVSKGEVVDDHKFKILESLKIEYEAMLGLGTNHYLIVAGQVLLVLAALVVLFLFLYNFRIEILLSSNKTIFILLLTVLFVSLAGITVRTELINLYVIPFALLPIIIRTFYDSRLAIFIHVVTIILIGFIAPNGFEFVFMQFIAGIVAIFSMHRARNRSQLFKSAAMVFLTYSFIYFALSLIHESSLGKIELTNFVWLAANGLLILTSYPLIYIFEKIFGFLSDLTLLELSDTNSPLLRELASKAPGTFQHSMQVANLAEEAIHKIGGNPLLIRTGALYHDIGKMNMAPFFIENQSPEFNPHDNLSFEESAEIIISHVTEGVTLAKKYKLPAQIIEFIETHHGTSTVQYFYKSFLKHYPEEDADISRFTYHGPIPHSRETAVLMMADSVEAASRSLKEYSERIIGDLIDNIVSYQRREGQFDDSDITFKELTMVKEVFGEKLRNIYHSRIEYPK